MLSIFKLTHKGLSKTFFKFLSSHYIYSRLTKKLLFLLHEKTSHLIKKMGFNCPMG